MSKILRDLSPITESGLEYKFCRQGVIIAGKVLIAKSKSRWKKLGDLNWHSYYGLRNLCKAIIDDTLDEYAFAQDFKNNRKQLAVVVKNEMTSPEAAEIIQNLERINSGLSSRYRDRQQTLQDLDVLYP